MVLKLQDPIYIKNSWHLNRKINIRSNKKKRTENVKCFPQESFPQLYFRCIDFFRFGPILKLEKKNTESVKDNQSRISSRVLIPHGIK